MGSQQKFVNADAQGDDEAVGGGELQHNLAKRRGVHRDEIEGRRCHRHEQHPLKDNRPVGKHGTKDLACVGMVLARQKLLGLQKRAPEHENQRHDGAANKKGYAPAPRGDLVRRQPAIDRKAERRGHDDGNLLACRLPGGVEAAVTRRGHFRQIDRNTAELRAGREALEQAADQNDHRGEQADGRVPRHEGDEDRPAGHDRQGHDESLAASDPVDVAAQDDRAEWPHEEAQSEPAESPHERNKLILGRNERLRDIRRVDAGQEEIELFEKVPAGDAKNRAEF